MHTVGSVCCSHGTGFARSGDCLLSSKRAKLGVLRRRGSPCGSKKSGLVGRGGRSCDVRGGEGEGVGYVDGLVLTGCANLGVFGAVLVVRAVGGGGMDLMAAFA